MKTKIAITGQPQGNFTLRNKLTNYDEITQGMFNAFYLTYATKAEAQKDLIKAKRRLHEEEQHLTRCEIYRSGGRPYMLTYDASKAEILDN